MAASPDVEQVLARLRAGEAVLGLDLAWLLDELGPTPPPWRLLATRQAHAALHHDDDEPPAPLVVVACACLAYDPERALGLFAVREAPGGGGRRLVLPGGGLLAYRVDGARRAVKLLAVQPGDAGAGGPVGADRP